MADALTLAKSARLTLAAALEALQSSDDVPEELLDLAEPIAKTMGILHRIEVSDGTELRGRDEALDNVRGALNALQDCGVDHEAVDNAMAEVAGSLSKLFALSKATAPAIKTRKPKVSGTDRPKAQDRAAAQRAREKREDDERKDREREDQERADQERADQERAVTKAAEKKGATKGKKGDRIPGMTDAPLPVSGLERVNVELGAHSGSNFYKGLGGNDVIDHGGIFVQTYKIPRIGAAIALRMLLPGDLEFEADAVVQWTRDTRSGETDPGFGAKFTRISGAGRQLIYRYTRNREPMFYDDL